MFYRLFKKDPSNREDVVTLTSVLGIVVNALIALIKIIAGAAVSSIAVVSEGVNNAADALSSILALVGVRLASKPPTAKHPFGYGRIEYFTSLTIGIFILLSGWELLRESIQLIIRPSDSFSLSYLTLGLVVISAFIKYFLGAYTIRMGKKVNASSLVALGLDGRNDAFVSAITVLSALVFIITGVSIDAYAGLIISALILKAGFEVLSNTLRDLIGTAGDKDLAEKLYRKIRAVPGVHNVADMMLHNYGPDRFSGSVNVEIDHTKTVGEVYGFLHQLQLDIMHTEGVTLVFGIYAVDTDREASRKMREQITTFVRSQPHVKSFHALYVDTTEKRIYCDFIVDYHLHDWAPLRQAFAEYLLPLYPDHSLELVIETEFV